VTRPLAPFGRRSSPQLGTAAVGAPQFGSVTVFDCRGEAVVPTAVSATSTTTSFGASFAPDVARTRRTTPFANWL
jgi:hypothetical protein